MQVWRMRTGISIFLKPVDRRRLSTVVRDRNAPHKHVWRAEIVLLSADGVGTNEIMRGPASRRPVCGAGRNASCRRVTTVFCLIRHDPRASHHSGRISPSVLWCSPRLIRPPRRPTGLLYDGESRWYQREFRPAHLAHAWSPAAPGPSVQASRFIDKLREVVGLYVDPPAHAI